MDTIIEKKGLKKKHIPYIVGGVLFLVAIFWLVFGNHASKLNVDAKRISVQPATRGEFNDYDPSKRTSATHQHHTAECN